MRIDYVAIGSRIRGLRKDRGLSQTALAGIVGISSAHMSSIENGNTPFGLPLLLRISEALETTPGEILSVTVRQNEPRQRALEQVNKVLASCMPEEAFLLRRVVRHVKMALEEYEQAQKNRNRPHRDKAE